MIKILLFVLVSTLSFSAFPFHVQIGYTWVDGFIKWQNRQNSHPSPNNPGQGWSEEIGEEPSYMEHEIDWYVGVTYDGGYRSVGATLFWPDKTNPNKVQMYSGSSSYKSSQFSLAEFVSIPTFGWINQYVDYGCYNSMITVRGNPYSVVFNDTDEDRTINGIEIKARKSKQLKFPIFLRTAEIPNAKFYDLESNDELTASWNGNSYELWWTGNIRITNDGGVGPEVPAEPLVFGDYVAANENKLLFAKNSMPIYANGHVISTNIYLYTWWDFTQEEWGGPKAYINDTCVCGGHSTDHIIAYSVSSEGMTVYGGKAVVDFTMTLFPDGGKSGGACIFKCWDQSAGGEKSGYEAAAATKKAAISGGVGTVAAFRITLDLVTGVWSVKAR